MIVLSILKDVPAFVTTFGESEKTLRLTRGDMIGGLPWPITKVLVNHGVAKVVKEASG